MTPQNDHDAAGEPSPGPMEKRRRGLARSEVAVAGLLGLVGGGMGHFYAGKRVSGIVAAIADVLAGSVLYIDYTCYPPSHFSPTALTMSANDNDWQILCLLFALWHVVQMFHAIGCAISAKAAVDRA